MPEWTSEVGLAPPTLASTFVEGNSYGVSIDTAKGISLPTGVVPPSKAGVLECYITIEGTGGAGITGSTSRYRWDGTNPSTTVGLILAAPSEFVPATLVIVGQRLINAFKIIGTAAGNKMSYTFAWRDMG
jgi:hypothetical protein